MSHTLGKWFVSHSPVAQNKVKNWFKSIKTNHGIGGRIICNCFGKTKEEAEANAAFVVKACNNYDKLYSALETMVAEFAPDNYDDDPRNENGEKKTAILDALEALNDCDKKK